MEKWSYAFQIMLFGFAFVLFAMFLLYLILLSYKFFFEKARSKEKALRPSVQEPESRVILPAPGISPKIVAAITAAVACSLARQDPDPGRNALSAPKQQAGGGGGWADAGRKALMDGKREIERLKRRG